MPTVYLNIPNGSTASVDLLALISASYPGYNCVTASVANLCYGLVTGSFTPIFSGSLSGNYFNAAITGSPVKRNNCTGGRTGSFVIPYVVQAQFSSSVSYAAANTSASTYLAANSQSMANGTVGISPGACFTSGARAVLPSSAVFRDVSPTLTLKEFPDNIDLQLTSNLPLTLSVLVTSSLWNLGGYGNFYPTGSEPNWEIVGYFSQSLFGSGSFTGWYSNYFNPISGAVFVKAIGADGKRILCGGGQYNTIAGAFNQYFIQAYPQQFNGSSSPNFLQFINVSEAISVTQSSFVPRVGLLLENNLSSSWIDEDHIRTYIRPLFSGSTIFQTAWTNDNMTASILWTTESSYPSQSDARWVTMGNSKSGSAAIAFYRTGSFNSTNIIYGINAGFAAPSVTDGVTLASTASYSGYTYIKFESGSSLIPNGGISVSVNGLNNESYINVVETGSYNDIIRFRTRYATGSYIGNVNRDFAKPDAWVELNISMSNTYL